MAKFLTQPPQYTAEFWKRLIIYHHTNTDIPNGVKMYDTNTAKVNNEIKDVIPIVKLFTCVDCIPLHLFWQESNGTKIYLKYGDDDNSKLEVKTISSGKLSLDSGSQTQSTVYYYNPYNNSISKTKFTEPSNVYNITISYQDTSNNEAQQYTVTLPKVRIGWNTETNGSGTWEDDLDANSIIGSIILYPQYKVTSENTLQSLIIEEQKSNFYGLWYPDGTSVDLNSKYLDKKQVANNPNGIVLNAGGQTYKVSLHLQNRPIHVSDDFIILYNYTVERDNFGYFKYFDTACNTDSLVKKKSTSNYGATNCFIEENGIYYVPDGYYYLTINEASLNTLRRKMLDADPKIPCIQLNIKCDMKMIQANGKPSITGSGEASQWESFMTSNLGYYKTSIALTFSEVTDLLEHKEREVPGYTIYGSSYTESIDLTQNPDQLALYLNKIDNPTEDDLIYPKLRTDFWKHGQAGIIDIQEKIKPCYWYGKQHPFEFEIIVGNQKPVLKQFTGLNFHTNNVIPESIHLTISGDQYSFFRDKRNMYFRQEATKAFYQENGSDILYDHTAFDEEFYKDKIQTVKANTYIEKVDSLYLRNITAQSDLYRSTILPLVYSRQDTFNEIEDYYKQATSRYYNYDYPNLTGGEVNYDWRTDSFSITNHIKVRDITSVGRMRGNIEFKDGIWKMQIPAFTIYQNNEFWDDVPPINLANAPVPKDMCPVILQYVESAQGTVLAIKNKTALEQLNTDGLDLLPQLEDFIVSTSKQQVENPITSLEEFLPAEVYKAGYKTTSNLDLTNWSEIRTHSTEAKLLDLRMKVKVRYKGDKLVLVTGVETKYNLML